MSITTESQHFTPDSTDPPVKHQSYFKGINCDFAIFLVYTREIAFSGLYLQNRSFEVTCEILIKNTEKSENLAEVSLAKVNILALGDRESLSPQNLLPAKVHTLKVISGFSSSKSVTKWPNLIINNAHEQRLVRLFCD